MTEAPPIYRGLLMGTVTVPNPSEAAAAWCRSTGFVEVDRHALSPLCESLWDADVTAHAEAIVLGAPSADRGYLRLVGTDILDYPWRLQDGRAPGGPLGYEFLSRDVDEAVARLKAGGCHVVGGPLDFDNGPAGGGYARAARVVAPGGFTCLINTIKRVPAPRALPVTDLLLGPVWNAIMTSINRPAVEAFYGDLLGMPVILAGILDQEGICVTNDLPLGWWFDMVVYGLNAPMQMIENEIHPDDHIYFPEPPARRLPRGNAIATVPIEALDPLLARAARLGVPVRGPARLPHFPYHGRRVAALIGPNREMFEFLEVAGG